MYIQNVERLTREIKNEERPHSRYLSRASREMIFRPMFP